VSSPTALRSSCLSSVIRRSPLWVTVLAGQASNGTSEGTAMLEIVYDMAPGASLYFATANGGQAQFAQNILDLQTAGVT
jgi:hypothetical protein